MIYSVSGKLLRKSDHYIVVETGGLGLKLAMSARALAGTPAAGSPVSVFSYLNVRENALELYGFLTEDELAFFEMLISVSGVGPKSALSILDVAQIDELSAAIKEGRPDLLTRAAGIGRKTAERVIIELRAKVESAKSGQVVANMDTDADLIDALVSLGYRRDEARNALQKIDSKVTGAEARIKAALGALNKK